MARCDHCLALLPQVPPLVVCAVFVQKIFTESFTCAWPWCSVLDKVHTL